LNAASINCLPVSTSRALLSGLTQDQASELEERWRFWLRDEQHAPEGSWRIGDRAPKKTSR